LTHFLCSLKLLGERTADYLWGSLQEHHADFDTTELHRQRSLFHVLQLPIILSLRPSLRVCSPFYQIKS